MNPLRTSRVSAISTFSFFPLFGDSGSYNLCKPPETPDRSMRICSMGAGDFITYVNPNRSMRICSMGPGDLITHVDPK